MLGELFQKVLDMSLIGCYSILIVMAVRLLLSRCERKFTYYLWFVVFLNLCIPLSYRGVFSLIPGFVAEFSVSDVVEDALASRAQGGSDAVIIPIVPGGAQGTDGNYNFALENPSGTDYLSQALSKETISLAIKLAAGVWLAGIMVLLMWNLAGMFRLKKQISRDHWIHFSSEQGIAEVEGLDTPFLWGIFNPMIYLPTDLEPEELRYIVAHELYHIKRKDYLIKIAVFLVAVIHWFNPLVWAAYTLFCRDMEISCDEAVLLEFKENIRKQYAGSLLKYAARQSGYVLSPITFGEPAVKTRIKNVLRFRKRGIVISILTVICVAGVAAGLVMRPFAEGAETNAGSQNGNIVLTEEQKSLLQTMCNYVPEFDGLWITEDEDFWRRFIFNSFTSVPTEFGKYRPIYGEGEQVEVYREDLGFEEGEFKISEKYVQEYAHLIFGVEMPEFKPVFEDMSEGQTALYYEDGYYYIGGSDFGEAQYRFRDMEVSSKQYDTTTLVNYDILLHNVDNGEQEVVGTIQFHLSYADNANGFVIVGKEVEYNN